MKIKHKNVTNNSEQNKRAKRFSLLKARRGVTLIELVVVVAILGSLIYILTKSIGGNKKNIEAGINKMGNKMAKVSILSSLDSYKSEFGTYPDPSLTLAVLYEQVSGAPENWKAVAYDKNVFFDQYKNLYHYKLDENGMPVIISLGADKVEGGTGENADVQLTE